MRAGGIFGGGAVGSLEDLDQEKMMQCSKQCGIDPTKGPPSEQEIRCAIECGGGGEAEIAELKELLGVAQAIMSDDADLSLCAPPKGYTPAPIPKGWVCDPIDGQPVLGAWKKPSGEVVCGRCVKGTFREAQPYIPHDPPAKTTTTATKPAPGVPVVALEPVPMDFMSLFRGDADAVAAQNHVACAKVCPTDVKKKGACEAVCDVDMQVSLDKIKEAKTKWMLTGGLVVVGGAAILLWARNSKKKKG